MPVAADSGRARVRARPGHAQHPSGFRVAQI